MGQRGESDLNVNDADYIITSGIQTQPGISEISDLTLEYTAAPGQMWYGPQQSLTTSL